MGIVTQVPQNYFGEHFGELWGTFGEQERHKLVINCSSNVYSGLITSPSTIFCDNFTHERHSSPFFTIKHIFLNMDDTDNKEKDEGDRV